MKGTTGRGQGGVREGSGRVQAGSEWKSSRILSLKHTPEILRRGSSRGQGGVKEGSGRGQGTSVGNKLSLGRPLSRLTFNI